MFFKNKELKNRIMIGSFVTVLAIIWIAGGLVSMFNHKAYKELTNSSNENRAEASIEWDELWSDGSSISSFIDDKFPFRNVFIKLYKSANGRLEVLYQKGANKIGNMFYKPSNTDVAVKPDTDKTSDEDENSDNTDEPVYGEDDLTCYLAPVVENDVLYGRRSYLFLYGENEIDYYQGTNLLSDEELEIYAEKVKTLQALCEANGKSLYMIFPANKSQVEDWLMPTIEVYENYKRTARLCDYLSENTTTPVKYLLEDCKEWENNRGWMTYYTYDTHWNTCGAFCGTLALYKMMGWETVDPASLEAEYLGVPAYDLAIMIGLDVSTLGYSSEYTVTYAPDVMVDGLDTEADVCRTTSTSGDGQRMVLIGDSFRKNMEKYISKDFSYCTFAHRDNITEINDDILNSNVIVIETIERQDYEAFEVVDYLINLLQ